MSKKLEVNRGRIIKAFDVVIKSAGKQDSDIVAAQEFEKLKLSNDEYLFKISAKGCSDIHDLGFLMRSKGVKVAYDYLVNIVIPTLNEMIEVGEYPLYSQVVFLSPLLEDRKLIEDAALALNDDKGVLSDLQECVKCGAPKTYHTRAQTRSADEGMTSLFKCPDCNFAWSDTGS